MKISASINKMVDNPESVTKAYASVTLDGMFAVHGLRVMESEKRQICQYAFYFL